MAELQKIEGVVEAVNDGGFRLKGSNVWVNYTLKPEHRKGTFPVQVGWEIVAKVSATRGAKGEKWWTGDIESKNAQFSSPPSPAPESLAGPHVPGNMAPTPTPQSDPPRNGPQPLSAETGPVLGTNAYTSLSIERQVALKAAVQTLDHFEGKYLDLTEAGNSILFLAEKYGEYLNGATPIAETAMPDDTPTPSEAGDPGPEYQSG